MFDSENPGAENPVAGRAPAPYWRTLVARLRRLSERPVELFACLFLLNAVWMPYRGISHDARLYAFELLNAIDGDRYHDALSLCYASAGKYSLFGNLLQPVAQAVGIPLALFAAYLVCKGFFLAGLQRLFLTLLPQRVLATVALLLFVVSPFSFGGFGIFHVNESFLTPRILAQGLVLFALDAALRRRFAQAVGIASVGLLIHPIMALPGVLVTLAMGAFAARHRFPHGRTLGVASLTGIVLTGWMAWCAPTLFYPVFGEMDPAWMDHIDDFNLYSIPQSWLPSDWAHLAITLAAVIAAGWRVSLFAKGRSLLVIAAAVGGLGVGLSMAAYELPFAKPFQAQPYRWVWLGHVLLLPSLLGVAWQLWHQRRWTSVLWAFAAVAYCLFDDFGSWSRCVLLFTSAVVCARLVVGEVPRVVLGWLGVLSVLGVTLAQSVQAVRSLGTLYPEALPFIECYFFWRLAARCCGPFCCVVLGGWLCLFLGRAIRQRTWRPAVFGACALLIQSIVFALPYSPINRWLGCAHAAEVAEVRRYLDPMRVADRSQGPPTVFWAGGDSAQVWFRLQAKSYFSPAQLAGTMFLRSAALEGRRRATLVAPFDLPAIVKHPLLRSQWSGEMLEAVYQMPAASPPTARREDLQRLCQNTDIDVLVCDQAIDNWYAGRAGRLFIYDLRALRKTSRQPEGAVVSDGARDRLDPFGNSHVLHLLPPQTWRTYPRAVGSPTGDHVGVDLGTQGPPAAM